MTAIGARAVAAAAALKPLGLTLIVSPFDFTITADPDHPSKAIAICSTIEQVEEFIADNRRTGAPRPAEPRRPRVSDLVHYVSFGTPGGEYGQECRAAMITEVTDVEVNEKNPAGDGEFREAVGLMVANPTGQFFNRGVLFDDGAETSGTISCPDAASHGNPFRYCACGWAEASYKGGTWHWADHA